MAHNDFTRPSGIWPTEIVPGSTDFQKFDSLQSKTINGDDGGATYTPTSPIIIGGAGMTLNASSVASGGCTTYSGGRVYLASAADRPVLNTRTRTVVIPVISAGLSLQPIASGQYSLVALSQLEEDSIRPVFGNFGVGVGFQPFSNVQTAPTQFEIQVPKCYLHSRAKLVTAGIQFVITKKPATVPTSVYPQFDFQQSNLLGTSMLGVNAAGKLSGIFQPNWLPTNAYAQYAVVIPTTANMNGFYFLQTAAAGTSGGGEPAWNTTVGSSTPDNGLAWLNMGRSGIFPIGTATPDTYYANGAIQSLWLDMANNVPASMPLPTIDVTTARYRFFFPLNGTIDPTMVITSLTLIYGGITSLGLE